MRLLLYNFLCTFRSGLLVLFLLFSGVCGPQAEVENSNRKRPVSLGVQARFPRSSGIKRVSGLDDHDIDLYEVRFTERQILSPKVAETGAGGRAWHGKRSVVRKDREKSSS